MKRLGSCLFLTVLNVFSVCAMPSSMQVESIEVKGLQKISEGTLYSYLPIKLGETISDEDAKDLIHALFKTGFFENVELSYDGGKLIINVKERPSIGSISLDGNKKIKTKDLLKGLKEAGLHEGGIFNPALLEKIKQELERQYYAFGRYGVQIHTSTQPLERNRVAVTIEINEGEIAKIREINIVGNQTYGTKELLKNFSLTTPGIWAWFKDSDQYSKQRLTADLETLRSFYMDRGFIHFQIESTQVSLTPDKENVFITINISEGDHYQFNAFEIIGELPLPADKVKESVVFKKGDIFSRKQLTESTNKIIDLLGYEGYGLAAVNPMPEINEETKTVNIKFYIDAGKRVYIRKINFSGNTKTYDEVLRRDMTQMESSWYSSKKVEDSKTRLNRSGYFKDVKVETKKVAGVPDQFDLNYIVEEASLGSVEGGFGYSDAEGFLINASVTNQNFLGTGNSLDFKFNNSQASTVYNLGYNNPYYTLDGIARGFNIFYNRTDLSKTSDIANYSTGVLGGSVNYGIPFTDVDNLNIGIGVDRTDLSISAFAPNELFQFVNTYGTRNNEATFTAGWTRNTLDRYIFPEKGSLHQANVSLTIPGSDLEYYRLKWQSRGYYPIGSGFIGAFRVNTGYGEGYGNTKTLPFYQHFFVGGTRTLRGYQENALGPRDSTNRPFGGNLMVTGSAALILPNFISPETRSVRFSLFTDVGQVYDLDDKTRLVNGVVASRNAQGLRYSVGLTFTWMSPIAPLEFSLAKPLNSKFDEKTQSFAFNFGTFF